MTHCSWYMATDYYDDRGDERRVTDTVVRRAGEKERERERLERYATMAMMASIDEAGGGQENEP